MSPIPEQVAIECATGTRLARRSGDPLRGYCMSKWILRLGSGDGGEFTHVGADSDGLYIAELLSPDAL